MTPIIQEFILRHSSFLLLLLASCFRSCFLLSSCSPFFNHSCFLALHHSLSISVSIPSIDPLAQVEIAVELGVALSLALAVHVATEEAEIEAEVALALEVRVGVGVAVGARRTRPGRFQEKEGKTLAEKAEKALNSRRREFRRN